MFAEQHLDEGQSSWVQLLELLVTVAHTELGNVEERLLLVFTQERGNPREHHVGQNTDAPKGTGADR